ncbi:A disintegrin and metalloproteinase with thrombospondin motifs adt-1-like isoform X1 [Branchiostoma floridae]|uniref:A disintegrin and metalloproteinase with thrombospondin motifs adt-1-like isoform X1 n=1 Tax=Branchiostoma floridae TaxID=7739 RepID=A0A9J7KQH2_BRAFL|nr:A disintegrin and metalloproteinase with thrombospondin motifs adt-1-like isoform X1 [Branchiostoma floridae]
MDRRVSVSVGLLVLVAMGTGVTGQDPCMPSNYIELNEPWRNVQQTNDGTQNMCDNGFAGEWYRFTGAAGEAMPTQAPPSVNRCGTDAPMWMNGQHPTLADGEVSRQACAFWGSNTCRWDTTIQVRACSGGYFVYKLPAAPACSLVYCGAGAMSVDGGWSDWGPWSTCSVTCGVGEQTRDRTCTNPAPANGGADCDGLTQETQACNTGVLCPVDGGWTDWGSWSACSVTCGVGEQTRDRTCTDPEPANGGADCDGLAQETQACDTGVSCLVIVDGGWTDWGSWSACSVTCGVGEQTRDRTCTNPEPANGGADCDGLAQETQACDTGVSCPVDGGWTDWGSWSACSMTCEVGEQTRDRTCTNPAPAHGGADCDGLAQETQACDTGVSCPVLPTRDCSDVYPHLRPAGNFGRYQNKYCFWSSAWRNRRLNYTKAQQECESNGGTLAMIKDASVQAFINNLLKTSSGRTQRNYWIGLDDLNREGVFEWNDGTKLGSYRRFKSKRPHKIRDCVALWRTAKLSRWFPLKCKIHLPYICQMDYNVNN